MEEDRYSKLLILQYQQTKATNTIKLLTKPLCDLVNNIFEKLLDAYDIDKAVGKQLDIVGMYVGQSRYFKNTMLSYKYFGYYVPGLTQPNYIVGYSVPPDNMVKGYYLNPIILNNNLNYKADDDTFRFFIKLRIAKRSCGRFTDYSIENALYKLFGGSIIFVDNRDMTISYILFSSIDNNIKNILIQNRYLLPAPAGVKIQLITAIPTEKIFGYYVPGLTQPYYIVGYCVPPNNMTKGTYLNPNYFV